MQSTALSEELILSRIAAAQLHDDEIRAYWEWSNRHFGDGR